MSDLAREWDEYVIEGNRISRDLDSFKNVMSIAELQESKVALYAGGGTTFIDLVLPEEVMSVLKTIVTNQLVDVRTRKEIELKKHMNRWKPATINPLFEAAVQGMVESNKKPVPVMPKVDPIEEKLSNILDKQDDHQIGEKPSLNVQDVKRMYHDENKSMKEIAEHFGVTKAIVNNFIAQNNLSRKKLKDDGYLDAQVEARTGRERA